LSRVASLAVGMAQAGANSNLLFKQILREYAGPQPRKAIFNALAARELT